MKEHSVVNFFSQFIRTIKQDIKNVGIITDKDGTLFLNDTLKQVLMDFRKKDLGVNIYIIANSGRTVQDMLNCLNDSAIPIEYFDYIVGDNGGMCVDIKEEKQLYKHVIDKEVALKVIEKFLEMGGNLSDIRITDGECIYAYPTAETEEYYRESKNVIFKQDMLDLEGIDITKITLTGQHKQINSIDRFIKENIEGYKTHAGKTSFPKKTRNNYRIDFTRNAYKRRSC